MTYSVRPWSWATLKAAPVGGLPIALSLPMFKKVPRPIKITWALGLTASMAFLMATDRSSAWNPILNFVIDALQQQLHPDPPKLPIAGEVPAGTGPLNLPTR